MAAVEPPTLILVMGVCATGKSTLGRALALGIESPFIDADDFHPGANIEKMRAGVPLDDADRWGWLDAVRRAAAHELAQYGSVVVACSALKAAYRARLFEGFEGSRVVIVFLIAGRAEIEARLRSRHESGGHFMPPSLLDSQLRTLEPPTPAEPCTPLIVSLDAFRPVAEQVGVVQRAMAG